MNSLFHYYSDRTFSLSGIILESSPKRMSVKTDLSCASSTTTTLYLRSNRSWGEGGVTDDYIIGAHHSFTCECCKE